MTSKPAHHVVARVAVHRGYRTASHTLFKQQDKTGYTGNAIPHLVRHRSWCHDNSACHPASVSCSESGTIAQLCCTNRANDRPAGAKEVRRQEALRGVLEDPRRGASTATGARACSTRTQIVGVMQHACVVTGCSAHILNLRMLVAT